MNDKQILENLAHKGREALKFLETDTAMAIFKDVLAIDEDYLDGWVGLAQVYYEQGKLKESEKSFDKALRLADKQLSKGSSSAKATADTWRQKKLSWKTEKNKPVIRLVHGLGVLMFRRGDNKQAKKWFELEHSLDPSLEAPLVMLADIGAGRKFNKLKYQNINI